MHEPAVQPPAPPAPELLFERWTPAGDDPALVHVRDELSPAAPGARWTCARLSKAAYVYREEGARRAFLAKFYAAKMPAEPERWAEHELATTQAALASGLREGSRRACQAFGAWRGVLFLEYVDGLTLDDVIAVRRNRPGTLGPALDAAAELLATLHRDARAPGRHGAEIATREHATSEARGYLDDLARTSLLGGESVLRDGLAARIDAWSSRGALRAFLPALVHGDATTTNFVYPSPDEVVAVDWERLTAGDPAGDVGRLAAEVANGVRGQGGSPAEAEAAVERVVTAYVFAAGNSSEGGFGERVRFHRAASTLRIARNGWVPQLERMRLVAQAFALLA